MTLDYLKEPSSFWAAILKQNIRRCCGSFTELARNHCLQSAAGGARYFTPSTCCERDHRQNPFLIQRGHSIGAHGRPVATTGRYCEVWALEDGPRSPRRRYMISAGQGSRQSQSTVPDLPRALWPSRPLHPPEGEAPRTLLQRVT